MSARILHHRAAARSFDLAEVKAIITGAVCLLTALGELGSGRAIEAEAVGAVADMLIPARQFLALEGAAQHAPRSFLAPDGEGRRAIGAAICILSALQGFGECFHIDPAALGAVVQLLAPVLAAFEAETGGGLVGRLEHAA